MAATILEVSDLTKRYGEFTAVDRISFTVNAGEIVGLLGPNGAGKTTTIHMLLSLLSPTAGTIRVFGKELWEHREEILQAMNFAAPYAALPYNLTVFENLMFFATLYGVPRHRERAEQMLAEFQLEPFRRQRAGSLSSGEQMRLALAKAFLNTPRLLLLDEPTVSLDPAVARELRGEIQARTAREEGAILWTSHNMREIESMCDRIIFLRGGRIIADDSPGRLRAQFETKDLEELFISLAEEGPGEGTRP
jgi:ABC-2 type transport system ATP-binding protein